MQLDGSDELKRRRNRCATVTFCRFGDSNPQAI
jgi:hypothetical protein